MIRPRLLLVAALAATAACDAQAPAAYEGDALGTIQGTIRNEAADAPSAAEVVLLWHAESEDDAEVPVAVKTEVEGSFPASFSLDLFEPAPDEALGALDGPDDNPGDYDAAIATILVYDPADAPEGTTTYDFESAISWEERHLVVYAPVAVPAAATESGVAVPAGFSLLDLTDGETYSPIDTPLEIRLVDDKSVLGFPYGDDG
jgi:hypothetical protein